MGGESFFSGGDTTITNKPADASGINQFGGGTTAPPVTPPTGRAGSPIGLLLSLTYAN